MADMRLIDASPLIEYFSGGDAMKSLAESVSDARFVEVLKNAPTIDAVPVVRCRECKHFRPCEEIDGVSWSGFCKYGEFHTDEEDFCSRGERKDDGLH